MIHIDTIIHKRQHNQNPKEVQNEIQWISFRSSFQEFWYRILFTRTDMLSHSGSTNVLTDAHAAF
jgi:hypothetical protein